MVAEDLLEGWNVTVVDGDSVDCMVVDDTVKGVVVIGLQHTRIW